MDALITTQEEGQRLKLRVCENEMMRTCAPEAGSNGGGGGGPAFCGLEVACWPLVPKFAGSNPAKAVGFFRAKKSSARLPSEGK